MYHVSDKLAHQDWSFCDGATVPAQFSLTSAVDWEQGESNPGNHSRSIDHCPTFWNSRRQIVISAVWKIALLQCYRWCVYHKPVWSMLLDSLCDRVIQFGVAVSRWTAIMSCPLKADIEAFDCQTSWASFYMPDMNLTFMCVAISKQHLLPDSVKKCHKRYHYFKDSLCVTCVTC